MSDEIKVYVVKYPGRTNLMMRYRDPDMGKQVARSAGTANQKKAEKAATIWEDELRSGRYQKPSRMTWEAFKELHSTNKLATMRVSSAIAYDSTINVFGREVNPQKLADVTTGRVTAFATKLHELGRSPATVARHLRHLKAVMNWAHKQGYLLKMPSFDMPKQAKGMRGRPITGEEFDRMIAVVEKEVGTPNRDSWTFYLRGLWASGLRLSESLTLRWDDTPGAIVVDLGGRRPMLRIPAEAEKGNKHRLLPITPEFAEHLATVAEADRRGYVFKPSGVPRTHTRVGKRISAIGKAAKVVTDQRDRDGEIEKQFATAHDLRRAFGFRWSRRVMPTILRELMRHESLETTMRYYVGTNAEATADELWKAVERQGNTLGNTQEKPSTAYSKNP
jgi:integrase